MENVNTETDSDVAASGPSTPSPTDVGTDDDIVFAVPQPLIPAKPNNKSERRRDKEEDPRLQLTYSILHAPWKKNIAQHYSESMLRKNLNQFDAYSIDSENK